MQTVIGPDNRETVILTLPSYRTHMRQTRQDGIMHDAIYDHDALSVAWSDVQDRRDAARTGCPWVPRTYLVDANGIDCLAGVL